MLSKKKNNNKKTTKNNNKDLKHLKKTNRQKTQNKPVL